MKPQKGTPLSDSLPVDSFFSSTMSDQFSAESFGDKNYFADDFDNETTGSNPFFKDNGNEKKASFDPRKYKADPGF